MNQTEYTRRFVSQAKQLIERGVVNSYTDIADVIEWDKTAISNVVNGRRNIPLDKYKQFTDHFKLDNPEYDQGFKDRYILLLERQIEEQKQIIRELQSAANLSSGGIKNALLTNTAFLRTIFHMLQVHRASTENRKLLAIQKESDKLYFAEIEKLLAEDR